MPDFFYGRFEENCYLSFAAVEGNINEFETVLYIVDYFMRKGNITILFLIYQIDDNCIRTEFVILYYNL